MLFMTISRVCYILNLYAFIRSLSGSVHMHMIRFCLFDAYQPKKLHASFIHYAMSGFTPDPYRSEQHLQKANYSQLFCTFVQV